MASKIEVEEKIKNLNIKKSCKLKTSSIRRVRRVRRQENEINLFCSIFSLKFFVHFSLNLNLILLILYISIKILKKFKS